MKAPFENPISRIAQATDAATRIVSLQADLFFLKQEIKGLRKLKQAIWLAIAFLIFTLFLALTLYWLEVGLHERGLSAFRLAALSFIGLGSLTLLTLTIAFRTGQDLPKNEATRRPEPK